MRHLFALLFALLSTSAHGGEGSIGHALLHGFTGCAAAELQGGDCAAGAASGMGQAFLAGALEDGHGGTLTQQQRQAALNDAQMLGAFMGYLFSGGDAGNVSLGGSIGQSGMAHNYLFHDEARAKRDALAALEACADSITSCSDAERTVLENTVAYYETLDAMRDSLLIQACQNPVSASCVALTTDAREAGYSYLNDPNREDLADDWMNAARAGSGAGPAWDPEAFGLGLIGGATLGLNGAAGVAAVREAARLCGSNPTCTGAILGQMLGAEIAADFAGGAVIITALDGTVLSRIDLNPPPMVAPNRGTLNVTAANPSASERAAAEHMAGLGRNVELRDPVGTRAGGGTSDLLVDGVPYDVYTPTSTNPNRIISAIAKKNDQAIGIVVDLSNSPVTADQLGNVLGRVNGAGATNITDIVIIGN